MCPERQKRPKVERFVVYFQLLRRKLAPAVGFGAKRTQLPKPNVKAKSFEKQVREATNVRAISSIL
jgi:hypothetical protein